MHIHTHSYITQVSIIRTCIQDLCNNTDCQCNVSFSNISYICFIFPCVSGKCLFFKLLRSMDHISSAVSDVNGFGLVPYFYKSIKLVSYYFLQKLNLSLLLFLALMDFVSCVISHVYILSLPLFLMSVQLVSSVISKKNGLFVSFVMPNITGLCLCCSFL